MTRVKVEKAKQNYRQQSLPIIQGGNSKAARMTISSAADKQSVHNDRWSQTLQMYSDYLIRY